MGVPGKTCCRCHAKKITCDKSKGRGTKDAEEPIEEVDKEFGEEPVVESKVKEKEPSMQLICIGRFCANYPLVRSTGVIVLPARRPVALSSCIVSKPVVLLSAPPAPRFPFVQQIRLPTHSFILLATCPRLTSNWMSSSSMTMMTTKHLKRDLNHLHPLGPPPSKSLWPGTPSFHWRNTFSTRACFSRGWRSVCLKPKDMSQSRKKTWPH
jgi:hypothetical protein